MHISYLLKQVSIAAQKFSHVCFEITVMIQSLYHIMKQKEVKCDSEMGVKLMLTNILMYSSYGEKWILSL